MTFVFCTFIASSTAHMQHTRIQMNHWHLLLHLFMTYQWRHVFTFNNFFFFNRPQTKPFRCTYIMLINETKYRIRFFKGVGCVDHWDILQGCVEHLSKSEVQNSFQSFLQCWGSMTFWCGSGFGSPDPYLWLMDPDPTIFFIYFKDAKKIFFSYFFL